MFRNQFGDFIDLDPDWIRIHQILWIRIRIQSIWLHIPGIIRKICDVNIIINIMINIYPCSEVKSGEEGGTEEREETPVKVDQPKLDQVVEHHLDLTGDVVEFRGKQNIIFYKKSMPIFF